MSGTGSNSSGSTDPAATDSAAGSGFVRGGQVRGRSPGHPPTAQARRAGPAGVPVRHPTERGLGMMTACRTSTGSTAPVPTPPGSWRRRPRGWSGSACRAGPACPASSRSAPHGSGCSGSRRVVRTREMAEEFGRQLAVLHGAGAAAFGSPPPGAPGPDGWIGDLPMPYAARDHLRGVLGAGPDRRDRPDGARPRRARRGAGGRGGPVRRRPPRRGRRRRAARPSGACPRRPVERQRPLGRRRAGVADRSGRPRWPRRVRPRDARAVRSAAPRADHRAGTSRSIRWRPAGRRGSPCTRRGRCWSTPPCSAAATATARWRPCAAPAADRGACPRPAASSWPSPGRVRPLPSVEAIARRIALRARLRSPAAS